MCSHAFLVDDDVDDEAVQLSWKYSLQLTRKTWKTRENKTTTLWWLRKEIQLASQLIHHFFSFVFLLHVLLHDELLVEEMNLHGATSYKIFFNKQMSPINQTLHTQCYTHTASWQLLQKKSRMRSCAVRTRKSSRHVFFTYFFIYFYLSLAKSG